jgi:ligand-binding sensor domain-containing protein/signal transduction histidine kinase
MRGLMFFLIVLFMGSESMGQQSGRRFSHLTVEDGLSQSTVKCMLKDSRGYMWFGTRDGLNRYNGYEFTIFKRDPEKDKSLSSNFITDLLEDKDGNLWVGTVDGFCKYDPATETFQRYQINNSSSYIADLFQDSKGTLWVGTNGGLYEFDVDNGTYKGYHHEPNNINSLVDSGINKMMEDQQGNFWIATPRGLDHYNPKTKVFTHYQHDPANSKSLGAGIVRSVFQDSKNRVWIATSNEGVSLFNPHDNSFTRFQHDPGNANSLVYNDVLSLTEDADGRLWIGTQNRGLSVFDFDSHTFKNYNMDINDPSSLGGISIHSLYKDDIGNIWIGSWAGGISLWSRYGNKFSLFNRILDINNTNVYALTGDSQGHIWLGVEEGGLLRFDPETNEFKKYPNENQQFFETNVIISIIELNEDTLAIGYHIGGFAFFDKKTEKFTHYLPQQNNPQSIYGTVKPSLLKDREGNIWIGDWGGGLNFYDREEKVFINYQHDAHNPNALSNGVVFALFEDKSGNIWIGTEGGLNLFDREKKQFIRYQHDPEDKQSISHNTVTSIFEDSRGALWIGTAGGLNLFDRKTKTFSVYSEKDGLPNDVINSILEDDQGKLWLGTNKGLSRFNPETRVCRNYDTKDGVQGNEFNRNAAYKAPDGTMYFGGTMGFNAFRPDNIQENPYIPPVVLTDLKVFNKSIVAGAEDSPLKQSLNHTEAISLPYDQSVITFHFAALNFVAPAKNEYASQLVGFDKDWNYVGNKRLATYTNLDPGTYTFRVKATNNDGLWNEKGTSLIIHILPPFWMTWWFKITIASLALGMGFVFYRYRLLNVKQQNQKLLGLVDERTQELLAKQEEINTQNEELLASNDELSQRQKEIAFQRDILVQQNQELGEARQIIETQNQNLDQQVKERTRELVEYNQQLEQFAFIAAHNLRAPVARMLGLGSLMKLAGISKEEERMITEKMVHTAEELDKVVKDINTILEIRKNNTLSISEVNLYHELQFIKANLAKEILETQTEIVEDYSQGHIIQTVKPYFDSILFNLISNAIKYRDPKRKPRIEIKTEFTKDYVCLLVSDNGLGIDLAAHKKNLFTLYKRFHSHVEGKGMGLYLVKTQAEALGGKITVESKTDKGTTFKVYLKR